MTKKPIIPFSAFLLVALSSGQSSKGPCDKLQLVTKKEWRSRPADPLQRMYPPLNRVIIAHTATNVSNCQNLVACIRTVQAIQIYHMEDMGWLDIAYNFVIGGDGRVYEGTGWTIPGAHTLGFNRNGIGVAFVGNYMKVAPSQIMLDAAQNLIGCGVEKKTSSGNCYEYAGSAAYFLSEGQRQRPRGVLAESDGSFWIVAEVKQRANGDF